MGAIGSMQDPMRLVRRQRIVGACLSSLSLLTVLGIGSRIGYVTIAIETALVLLGVFLIARLVARGRRPRYERDAQSDAGDHAVLLTARRLTSLLGTSLGTLRFDAAGFRYTVSGHGGSANALSIAWRDVVNVQVFAHNRFFGYSRFWARASSEPEFVEFSVWATPAEIGRFVPAALRG